jgi:hypothetical protein
MGARQECVRCFKQIWKVGKVGREGGKFLNDLSNGDLMAYELFHLIFFGTIFQISNLVSNQPPCPMF